MYKASQEVTNIRYGPIREDRSTVQFDFHGETVTITEPEDVILVGSDPDSAAQWIVDRYWWILLPLLPEAKS